MVCKVPREQGAARDPVQDADACAYADAYDSACAYAVAYADAGSAAAMVVAPCQRCQQQQRQARGLI